MEPEEFVGWRSGFPPSGERKAAGRDLERESDERESASLDGFEFVPKVIDGFDRVQIENYAPIG